MLSSLAHWLEPSRDAEYAEAEAKVAEAEGILSRVTTRSPRVRALVVAHRVDRVHNHYGERIRRALEGGSA